VVVTLEDHVLMGGYGSSVLELFNEKSIAVPLVRIGWPDQFIEHATAVDYLREKYGLTVENILAQVKAELGAGNAPAPRLVSAMVS
jgi:1-deoxy-D-xylulose-5-phosphate synthase